MDALKLNIALIGLGGQGIITLSKLMMSAYLEQGYKVCMNEIHGLSQRGGSVQSFVCLGRADCPVFSSDDVDIVIGMEELETLRFLYQAKKSKATVIVTNTYDIRNTFQQGIEFFPDAGLVGREIAKSSGRQYLFDAKGFEQDFQSPLGLVPTNIALFGALTRIKDVHIDQETAQNAVTKVLGKNAFLLDVNTDALNQGRIWMKEV